MGAIIRIDKMPGKCSECPFTNKERTFCRLRNSRLIAGKNRNSRMPLCPLINEGEYLSEQFRRLKRLKNKIGGTQ